MSKTGKFDNLTDSGSGNEAAPKEEKPHQSEISIPACKKLSAETRNERFRLGADSSSGSDSEKETEILEQAEDIKYGATPPRQARRIKNKAKAWFEKKERKLQVPELTRHVKEKQKHLSVYRREKDMIFPGNSKFVSVAAKNIDEAIAKKFLAISTNSLYRSIKSVPANLNRHAENDHRQKKKPTFLKCRSCHDVHGDYDCPTSRLQFLDSIKRQIKLGDGSKSGRRVSKKIQSFDEEDGPKSWQIEFDQVLWLELQAWHAGRSVEDQDTFLLEERKKIDSILEEIMNFNFSAKLEEINSQDRRARFSFSKHAEKHSMSNATSPDPKSDKQNPSQPSYTAHDVSHNCTTILDYFTGPIQQKAMQIIIMLLLKVQNALSLYPTTRALSQFHPIYMDQKFQRNCETLNLWLNICKELYHKLQIMATLISVDVEDDKSWKDWMDHGLGLTCVKTHQTYTQRSLSFTSKEDPGSPNSLLQHTNKRRSILKETSTSRYRPFVEKNIRKIGLNGLTRRIKVSLHTTLWKARQALEVPKDEHDIMERQHSYGKVTDLVEFLEKTAIEDPSQKAVLSSISLHLEDFQTQDPLTHERGVWSQEFSEMGLPSFLELYLFLAKIAFDIMHESIRYRLDNRPKGDPSHMSIRQLLNECKEVISTAIIGKYYYQDMALSVLTADDTIRIDAIDNDITEFEEDIKSLLSVYFEYLQSLFQMFQRLPEASRSLKNTMEDEWQFAKEICPHTKGLEAKAGRSFCVLASGLLDSTALFLESSLDDCSSELFEKMDRSSEKVKDIALEACRNHKKLFNEIRERAAKALGFAKMLQKDLGIAAEYKVEVGVENILQLLKTSGHVKVDCKSSDVNYEVYTKQQHNKRQILKLLNVTCGFEDPAEANSLHNEGYLLLLNLCDDDDNDDRECSWDGDIVQVSPTVDTTIALANLQVDGLMVISCNSYQLSTQRIMLMKDLGNAITLVNEQTSSHQTIAEALCEFRDSAERLAQGIVSSVKKTSDTLKVIYEMENSEKTLVHKNYVETMHLCFNTGFEYLRELARLLSGRSKELYPSMMGFSNAWMEFVYQNIESGRGKRPRWSTQGLEFIIDACNPRYLAGMKEEEFLESKRRINKCITYIIGSPECALASGYKSGSPLQMHRVKSLPSGHQSGKSNRCDKLMPNKSLSDSFGPSQGAYNLNPEASFEAESPLPTSADSSINSSRRSSAESMSLESSTLSPIDRIRNSLKKLEKRRNEKLIKKCTIGRVSDKKPDLASELVNIKSRRVNFKWLLGYKIGEGQFGKIYSCVNLDSGKLMAMKKIRVNPHDYSSIQDIADEITNIQCLRHESLVEYHGVEIHKDEMLIFMEYCGDGTIADVAKIGLPEQMIRVYTLQIVDAVKFVHQNGIVHRDIKGANIFVSSSGIIKLGDFGSAVKLKDPIHTMHGELSKFRGTAAFMAPEIINRKEVGYGRAADIWSLGCVVIEMVTGKMPWAELESWYSIIFRVGGGAVPMIPESLSEEGKEFLDQCFINDPKSRWTAEMLEDHPFVKCC